MSSESQELSYYTTSIGESSSMAAFLVNNTWTQDNLTSAPPYMLPAYFQTTSIIVCVAIMVLGIIGNLLVPIVVFRNKDMRNSTNIFLVNLSIADLCVLLICTPTILMEVISGPQVWPLGKTMCIIVPFVELTVAHASVLTILAISFERYYAICEPLRAGYVCTKARAFFICVVAWIAAALCTSPMIWISDYLEIQLNRSLEATSSGREESKINMCVMVANSAATMGFFIGLIVLFFFVPLIILVWLYTIIVRHLIHDSSSAVDRTESYHIRARRQVILMLLTVVFSFFICLSPIKLLTFYLVVAPAEYVESIDNYLYVNILYFCRIMFYLNSAVNPILYNLMSSKFRIGFFKLCRIKTKRNIDRGTFKTTINSRVSRTVNSEQLDNFL